MWPTIDDTTEFDGRAPTGEVVVANVVDTTIAEDLHAALHLLDMAVALEEVMIETADESRMKRGDETAMMSLVIETAPLLVPPTVAEVDPGLILHLAIAHEVHHHHEVLAVTTIANVVLDTRTEDATKIGCVDQALVVTATEIEELNVVAIVTSTEEETVIVDTALRH
jgi:hypothetical protein